LAHVTNARELSMTDDDPSRESGLPMHPGVAAYETRLIWLERELPSFERELARIEDVTIRRTPTDCSLSH
jgi:hypothetical protein